MDESRKLGTEAIGRLLLKFSIPAIIAMVVNAIYNVVDRAFVGKEVGNLGLAGITISFPIMILLMAFGMLIGIGGSTLISIKLGEGNKTEAEHVLLNGVLLLAGGSVIIGILFTVFMTPLLTLFGASSDVLPYASEYLSIIFKGVVFQALSFGMNNYIRAEGNPKVAMITMLLGAISNIIFDYIFIKIMGMGLTGAALGTIIAQAISAAWIFRYYLSGNSVLKLHLKDLKLKMEYVKKINQFGMPACLMQVAAALVVVILNNRLYLYGGDRAISAYGIINSAAMMILMPIFGISQGVQPIIGYNFGAKQFHRMKEAVVKGMIFATIIVLVGWTTTRIWPSNIINVFIKDDLELMNISLVAMKLQLLAFPIIGFQIIGSSYFQAVGKFKEATFLSLSRQLLILVPAIYFFSYKYQLTGVWMAGPVADSVSALFTIVLLGKELKMLPKEV